MTLGKYSESFRKKYLKIKKISRSDPQKCITLISEIMREANAANEYDVLGELYYSLGYAYFILSDTDNCTRYFNTASHFLLHYKDFDTACHAFSGPDSALTHSLSRTGQARQCSGNINVLFTL